MGDLTGEHTIGSWAFGEFEFTRQTRGAPVLFAQRMPDEPQSFRKTSISRGLTTNYETHKKSVISLISQNNGLNIPGIFSYMRRYRLENAFDLQHRHHDIV